METELERLQRELRDAERGNGVLRALVQELKARNDELAAIVLDRGFTNPVCTCPHRELCPMDENYGRKSHQRKEKVRKEFEKIGLDENGRKKESK